MYSIKKKNPFFILLLLIVLAAVACNFNGQRTKTIKIDDGSTVIKIEYCGQIDFSVHGETIETISPDGYVKYRNGDDRFYAQCDDDGNLTYKLYRNSKRLQPGDAEAAAFMKAAVKTIEEYYYR